MQLQEAQKIAGYFIDEFTPIAEQVSIGGSIRRGLPTVKDIEIVIKPFTQEPLMLFTDEQYFGPAGAPFTLPVVEPGFYDLLGGCIADVNGVDYKMVKRGPKYWQIELGHFGINLDIFIVTPPASWGVILALRTGGARFSKKLVTTKRAWGFLPYYYRVKDGQLWARAAGQEDKTIPTPTEKAFFEAINLPWLEPQERDDYALRY